MELFFQSPLPGSCVVLAYVRNSCWYCQNYMAGLTKEVGKNDAVTDKI